MVLFVSFSHAQKLKTIKKKVKNDCIERYTVLKDDKKVHHGSYNITKGKTIYVEGHYDNGKKTGYWTYTHNYCPVKGADKAVEYYENGYLMWTKASNWSDHSTSYYRPDNKIDSIVYFLESIKKTEVYDKDTIRIHKRTTDGKYQIHGQCIGDVPVGVWKYTLRNSTAVMRYVNGKLVGRQTSYYLNGQVQKTFIRNDSGRIDGDFLIFFENGDTLVHARYLDGDRQGISKVWHSNGQLFTYAKFQKGRLLTRTIFDENGEIVSEMKTGDGLYTLYSL